MNLEDKMKLKKLLEQAAESAREYASAIDNLLYQHGGYYAGREHDQYVLAAKLDQVAEDLFDKQENEEQNK